MHRSPPSRAFPTLLLAFAMLSAACGPSAVAPAGTSGPPAALASPSDRPAAPSPTPTPAPTATPTPEPKWDEVPVAANDPAPLAAQLAMVERAIRDPGFSGAKLVWMGHLQQLVYSQLRDYPDWQEGVIGTLPADVQAAVRGALEASRQLRRLHVAAPKTLPDWRIVEPAPVDSLLGYYREAEAQFGVPWYYLAAIHLVETRMGRIRGLSSAGAQGPMQFMPATWAAYGRGDVNSDRDSILAAGRYLRASGAPGDMARALFAYNRHDGYVRGITAYAEVMKADANAYRGYYGWQVYYGTVEGTFLLPVGWTKQ